SSDLFLPDQLAEDANALDRFRREAQSASALNHPNICTIYDIDAGYITGDGQEKEGLVHFIAMELLVGNTLKHVMETAPLEFDLIVELGIQIADGLDSAHSE